MTSLASVYATFPDAAEAERISRAVIEARLAACVNILGSCRSIYRWRGAVEEADEVAAIFKTTVAGTAALIEAIAAAHSYDAPAVVAWQISSAAAGLSDWVVDSIGGADIDVGSTD